MAPTLINNSARLLLALQLAAIAAYATASLPQTCHDVYTSLPAAPVFPTTVLSDASTPALSDLVVDHWSEIAKVYRPPFVVPDSNPTQTNCPHLTGTFVNFHDLRFTPGMDITLPDNTRVLVHSCSVGSNDTFGLVTIPKTSELIFGDAPINFQVKAIRVLGKLLMGSATCRLRNKITLTFYGRRDEQALPGAGWVKGILATNATVEMHGVQYTPTWTRLAKTAQIGDDLIFIQDSVNWEVGQTILVTTTELKDSRDFNHNEEKVISAIYKTKYSNVTAIRVSTPFVYKHFAGKAYQAEVALLSRRIVLQGDATNSEPIDMADAICNDYGSSTYPCNNKYLTGFGVQVRVEGSLSTGRFEGLELYRAGQTNVLGHYALHFHMIGQSVTTGALYVKDCSVHRSYFRAYAVHGTNNVLISQNVAYDVIGHAYFIEDGVEEDSTFEYNFGAHIHWLGDSQRQSTRQWYGSQGLYWVDESADMILPSDSAASVYYITNAHNNFIGNAASGGWAGYSFPNLPRAVKLNINYKNGIFTPSSRNTLAFKGNTAHSTGYWFGSAGGVYVGGTLKHDETTGVLTYTGGRDGDRSTCLYDPLDTTHDQDGYCNRENELSMLFEDTKVFLSTRGMQHWGSRSDVIRTELHDVGMAFNVFGSVFINQLLVQCRSLVHLPTNTCPGNSCSERDNQFWNTFTALNWYDVGQNHIMTSAEFRNCLASWQPCNADDGHCNGATVFKMLTHSYQFVPEVMQATRNITYTNCDDDSLVAFTVEQDVTRTVSGRLANWVDWDGSVFPGAFPGQPVLLGSQWANDWWKTSEKCLGPKENLWICPKGEDSSASIVLYYDVPSTVDNDIVGTSQSMCPNGEGDCPIIGSVTHFGRAIGTGLDLAMNPKVTGPIIKSSGGWFVKFNSGTPRTLYIGHAQVNPNDVLLLAIPYPKGTTFTVRAYAPSWCDSSWARCTDTLVPASSVDEVRAAYGDKYYYNSTSQLLYFRVVQKNDDVWPYGSVDVPHTAWTQETVDSLASFTRDGITLMKMEAWEFHVRIIATNCGGSGMNCAPVSASVPGAVATESPVAFATWTPTSLRTHTPTTPAPSTASPDGCVGVWDQCGGGGNQPWSVCCMQNMECVKYDSWWSQCEECADQDEQCAGVGWSKCCQRPYKCTAVSASESYCRSTNSPTVPPFTTPKPTTPKPTSKAPTTRSPTSKSPTTGRPSKAPTTSRPSKTPTNKPSKAPTTSRPSKAPTTSRPSKAPTPPTTRAPSKPPTKKRRRRG